MVTFSDMNIVMTIVGTTFSLRYYKPTIFRSLNHSQFHFHEALQLELCGQ